MNVDLIYATWPNSPSGINWHKLAGAVREAGLAGRLTSDGFKVSEHVLEATGKDAGDLRQAFQLAAEIGALVRGSQRSGSLPVIICGSCSVSAMGALSGLGGEDTGVLWMDAHADLNTPQITLSGLFEGMAVAKLLGEAWQAMAYEIAGLTAVSRRNLCFYGTRDIDAAEQHIIDEEGFPIVDDAEGAIDSLEYCERVYLHLDMDVHNGADLKVSAYSRDDGPPPEKVRQDLAELAARLPVAAFSVASLDPDVADPEALDCVIAHVIAVAEGRRQNVEAED